MKQAGLEEEKEMEGFDKPLPTFEDRNASDNEDELEEDGYEEEPDPATYSYEFDKADTEGDEQADANAAKN